MATIYDAFSFAGTPGSSLASYSDGNGTLSQCSFTSGTAQTTNNGSHAARPGGANSSLWIASNTASNNAYVVSCDFLPQATSLSGYNVRIYNRLVSSSTHTGYALAFGSATPIFGLRILQAGTVNIPTSAEGYAGDYTPSYAVGDRFSVTLTVTNAANPTVTATIRKNGSYLTSLSFTDNGSAGAQITGTGYAALGFNVGIGSPSTPGDTAGILATNFQVYSPEIDPVSLQSVTSPGLVNLAPPPPLVPVACASADVPGLVTLSPHVPIAPPSVASPDVPRLVTLVSGIAGTLKPVSLASPSSVGLCSLSPPAHTITISTPVAWQVIQRSSATSGSIAITGTFGGGTPSAIQASFAGSPWSDISATFGAGTYSGTLSGVTPGQGTLSVRWSSDFAATASVPNIGVGDVYVLAGQSNMTGHGDNPQAYTTPPSGAWCSVYRKDGTGWHPITRDPYDTGSANVAPAAGNQAAWGASTPADSGTVGGAYALLVASQIAAATNLPVGLIPAAFSGAGLVNAGAGYPLWGKTAAGLGSPAVNLYQGLLNSVRNSGSGTVKAILWHQGEADAKNGTTQAAYLTALTTLAANLAADVPGAPPMLVAQIGDSDTAPPAALDGIRAAQAASWNTGTILPGPTCYSTDLTSDMSSSSPYYSPNADSLHFHTNQALADLASRWFAAISAAFYGGTDGRGPQVASAVAAVDRSYVDVSFRSPNPPIHLSTPIAGLSGNGFTVTAGGSNISGVTAAMAPGSTTTVRLTLPAPAQAGVTLATSLGVGNSAGGQSVPLDSGPYTLPAEPFYNLPVSPPVVFRREFSMLYGKVGQRQPVDL
jgi:hypothetical protein